MADITDPDVVSFVNEVIRPWADRMAGMDQVVAQHASRWFNDASPNMSGNADGDLIVDGSESDGRIQLSKAEVTNVMTQILAFQTQMNGAGVRDVIVKASVNPNIPG